MKHVVFALALGAAVLHATWNVLLAGARDSEAATAVATMDKPRFGRSARPRRAPTPTTITITAISPDGPITSAARCSPRHS